MGEREPIVLLEPRLQDRFGHFLSQACALTRAFRGMGHEVTVLCAADAAPAVLEELRDAGAICWNQSGATKTERLRARVAVWPAFAVAFSRDLRRLARTLRGDEIVIASSAELDVLLGLALATESRAWSHRVLAQLFYWDRRAGDARFPLIEGRLEAWTRAAVRRAASGRLRIVGHSAPIARALARRLELPVAHTPLAVEWSEGARGPRSEGSPRVGYVGASRDEKGLAQMSRAVSLVTEDVGWAIQAGPHPHAHEPDRLRLVENVRARGGRVEEEPLPEAAYAALLRTVDIFACPYVPERYAERTSGVVIEAVGLGGVPIVPAGTWLAEFVGDVGVGEVYSPYTPEALAEAIDRVAADWPARRAAAAQLAEGVRTQHSPPEIARRLISLHREAD